MRFPPGVALVVGGSLAFVEPSLADAPATAIPESSVVSVPFVPSPPEKRCEDLFEAVHRRAAELRATAAVDTVSVVEAEEIALVADDLVAEGSLELAEDLLREALALIAPEPASP